MPDNNWTLISGSTSQDYTDTAVFEVNPDTKQIALITGQALVAGEKDSQYISFVMPRYWDGIDISSKTFTIEYALAGTYYGTSEAVNAEMTSEQVRFGWIVPETACAISGTLLFILKITSEGYTLKTQIAEHPVFKTIRVEDVVPEPTKEAWYREFQTRVDSAIEQAESAIETVQSTLTDVEAAAQLAQTAAQDAQTAQETVESASQAAQTSAQVAQVSQEAAEAAAASAQTRYGSPLVATTAEEMTDENRVYVYVGSESGYTNGHWYYYDGTEWADGGVYNGTGINTDTTLTQAGMAADAKATGDEISQIKEGLTTIPSVKDSDADEGVFDLTDTQGNVILRLADGHIKTKNFDSSDINVGNTAKISTTSAQTDLDIVDANGYVAVRIKDGAIITPSFNTNNAVDAEGVSSIITDEFPSQYLEKYRLNGIKWDALGDSLTAPATVGLSHKNYTRWIAEANGISLNNLGVGGKGYWQGIEDEVAGIRSDTDIVTIFGSLNDIGNYINNPGVPTDTWADGKTNYCARARRVFDAILAVRNDIRIGVILPTPWVNYNCYDTATATQENVENMLDALKGICKIYGIPVLDMYHGSNLRPWDSDFRDTYYVASDGYHPNELGNKLFVAPQIEAFLRSLAISY